MRRFFQWTLGVAALFVANEAATQFLTVMILGFVVGGAVQQTNSQVWLISALVVLFLSLCAQFGRRFYRDRYQPYRIRKTLMSLELSNGGEHVIFNYQLTFRVRHSELREVVQGFTWSGLTNLSKSLHDRGSGYRMTSSRPSPDVNKVFITFKFNEPVKRFRTATVAIQARLFDETGFPTVPGGKPSYDPHLSVDSAMEAHSLFSRINLSISWDNSLEPNWNRITWKEFRGKYDFVREHSALRDGKGERLRLGKHQNAIGVHVKPNTFNTFLRLDSAFSRVE